MFGRTAIMRHIITKIFKGKEIEVKRSKMKWSEVKLWVWWCLYSRNMLCDYENCLFLFIYDVPAILKTQRDDCNWDYTMKLQQSKKTWKGRMLYRPVGSCEGKTTVRVNLTEVDVGGYGLDWSCSEEGFWQVLVNSNNLLKPTDKFT
jgi:hypothetical protein